MNCEEAVGKTFQNGVFLFTVREISGRKATIVTGDGEEIEMGVGRLAVYLSGATEVESGCAEIHNV